MTLKDLAKDTKKIEEYISSVHSGGTSDIDKHKLQIALDDEQVKKNYTVMLFFSANTFIQCGADSDLIFKRLFSLIKSIYSQTPLNVENAQAVIRQSLLLDENSIKENVSILRQHGLIYPLFYDMFLMLHGEDSKAMDSLINLSKKEIFELSDFVETICREPDFEKRISNFEDIVVQKESQKADEKYRSELAKLEKENDGKSDKIRYANLYNFHQNYNDTSSMVKYADILYKIYKGKNNVDDAILWLKRATIHDNSPERRQQLRELFRIKCPNNVKDPDRFPYEKVYEELNTSEALDELNAYDRDKAEAAIKPTAPPPPKYESEYESKTMSASNNDNSGCGCLLIIALIILGVVGYFFIFSDSSEEEQTQTIVEETTDKESAHVDTTSAHDYTKTQKTELSLGGLDIGVSHKQVHDILGKEKSKEEKNNRTILKYDHIDVELQNDNVCSLISNTADALTLRGIHQGSSLQDVIKTYGEASSSFKYDNLIINEYKYTSLDNRQGILRFAIKPENNTVEYISVRFSDELKNDNNDVNDPSSSFSFTPSLNAQGTQSTKNTKPAISEDDIAKAEKRLNYFFRHLTMSDSDAYKVLSSNEQKRIGNISKFHSVYPVLNTINIKSISVDSVNQDSILFSYSIETSRHQFVKGRNRAKTIHQALSGKVQMVKEFGEWCVNNDESNVTAERIED